MSKQEQHWEKTRGLLIMTLAITYINTGIDRGFLNRWSKAFMVGFPIAVVAAAVIAPIAKKLTKKFTS